MVTEIREAPSTIQEQARIEADKALQRAVATAGAYGGSVASNFGASANLYDTLEGDVLRETSALRAQEYADRLNQRASLLSDVGATSGALAELGLRGADLQRGVSSDIYGMMSAERAGKTGLLSSLAQADFGASMAVGRGQVDVGSALYERALGLLDREASVVDMDQETDLALLGLRQTIPGMVNGCLWS